MSYILGKKLLLLGNYQVGTNINAFSVNDIARYKDRTTDSKKNSIVNILMGTLNTNVPSLLILLCSNLVSEINTEAIVQVIKIQRSPYNAYH